MAKLSKHFNMINKTKCIKVLILSIVMLFFVMLLNIESKAIVSNEISDINNDGKITITDRVWWALAAGNTYTATYNYDNATSGNTEKTKSITNGSPYGTLANPVRKYNIVFKDGTQQIEKKVIQYAFLGWYKTQAFSEESRISSGDSVNVENNINLYAKWQETSFVMPRAEKTGYTLDGWYDKDTGTKYKASDSYTAMLTKDKEFTATWKANQYTIEYNGNGSTSGAMSASTAVYDSFLTLKKNTYKKTGYEFTGWSTNANGTGTKIEDAGHVKNLAASGKVTLYAQWKEVKCTVTFEYNGGNENSTEATRKVIKDGEIGSLPSPSKKYKIVYNSSNGNVKEKLVEVKFEGWYAEPDFKTKVNSSYKIKQDQVIYAKYNDYDVTIESPEGNGGKTFYAWYNNQNCEGTPYHIGDKINTKQIRSDIKLYAQWLNNGYMVTYDYDGATGGNQELGKEIKYDEPYGELPSVEKGLKKEVNVTYVKNIGDGNDKETSPTMSLEFNGWHLDKDYRILIKGTDTVSKKESHTLYAEWGSKTVTLPSNLTREGYALEGWYEESDFSGTKYEIGGQYIVRKNATLYAKWINNKVTVTFETNGGTEIESQEVEKGKTVTIPTPTKEGYTFKGWYSDEQLKKKLPVNGDQYIPSEDITIYAKWEVQKYKLTYELDGGKLEKGVKNPSSYTIEDTITLSNPTKKGCTFKGWKIGNEDAQEHVTIIAGSTGDRKYIAQWAETGYQITYDLQGGSLPEGESNPKLYSATTITFTLPTPTKEGYTFSGWIGSNGNTPKTEVTIKKGSTGDKNYIAKWKAKEYSISYKLDGGSVSSENPETYSADTNTFTLTNPTKQGYDFVGWTGEDITDSSNPITIISEPQKTVTITKGSSGDREYTAHWEPSKNTPYTIIHEQMNLDGSTYTTVETQKLTGETGKTVISLPKTYPGFTTPEAQPITILADGSASITYKYARNKYQFTLGTGENVSTEESTESGEYYYGQKITLKATANEGYENVVWTSSDTSLVPNPTSANTSFNMPEGNITMTPSATIKKFTMTFNSNGGSSVESQQIEWNSKASKPTPDPTKEGHTFEGWYVGETEYDFDTAVIGDVELEAKWEINKYTVTWQNEDGTELEKDENVEYGTTPSYDGETPTKAETDGITYTFNGWTPAISEVTEDVIYKAQFTSTVNTYTIIWQNEDGTELEKDENVEYGTIPSYDGETPTKGSTAEFTYTFSGWNPAISETTEDVTYIAQFTETKNKYTVIFNGNGGIVTGDQQTVTQELEYDTEITLPLPTRYGYTFVQWITADSGYQANIQYTVTSNVTFTAEWEEAEVGVYVILLDTDEDGVGETLAFSSKPTTDSHTVKDYGDISNTHFETPQDVAWFSEREQIKYVTFADRVSPISTAKWFCAFFNLEDIMGIENLDTSNVTDMNYMFHYCSKLTSVDVSHFDTSKVTKMNFMFCFCSELTSIDVSHFVTSNVTKMDAMFKGCTKLENLDVSSFNTSRVTDMESMFYGTKLAQIDVSDFDTSNVTRMGWMFSECDNLTQLDLRNWNVSNETEYMGMFADSGLETIYGNKTWIKVNEDPDMCFDGSNTDHVIIELTVTFDANGGKLIDLEIFGEREGYEIKKFVNYNDTIKLLTPTRENYEFINWTANENNYDAGEEYVVKDDVTFVANWRANEYEISYNLDGGTLGEGQTNPTIYTVETESFTLNNPSKTGYEFKGWAGTDLEEATKTVTIEKGSTGERTYTAQWEAKGDTPYTVVHKKMDLDGTNYTVEETEELTGVTGAEITPEVRSYTGFTAPATQTVTISADGDTEVVYEYTRNKYQYTLGTSTGADTTESTLTGEYYFEEEILLRLIAKEGYENPCWISSDTELASNPTELNTSFTMPAGDLTMTPSITVKEYTISYELNDGALAEGETNPTTYTVETESFILNNPTKQGYIFTGWTGTDLTDVTQTVTIEKGSIGNRTYTANWEAIEYTITYDLDEGALAEGELNPTTYTVETESFTLNNPSKTGYEFKGWTGTDLEETTITVTVEKGSSGERTYTAVWEAKGDTPYTVVHKKMNLDGTNYTVSETEELTGATGTEITPQVKSYTGFTAPVTQTVTISAEGDTEVVYEYTRNKYQYTLGTSTGADTTGSTLTGEYYFETEILLRLTAKEGYDNPCWISSDAELVSNPSELNTSFTVPAGNITMTPSVTLNEYTINYDLDGGELEEGQTNPTTYTVETNTFTLNDPSKTGYDFKGWTGTDLEEATETVTIEKGSIGDRTYTATWKIKKYTISYDLDGGELEEGQTNPNQYTSQTDTFTLSIPTKSGYTFLGWAGTDLIRTMPLVIIEKGSTGDRTYTAVWDANGDTPYTVIHEQMDLDGENYTVVKVENLKGVTGESVTPHVKNYDGFTAPDEETIEISADEDVTVIYKYTRNKYNYTLESVEGIDTTGSTESGEYYYGENINLKIVSPEKYENPSWTSSNTDLLSNPTSTEYTFKMPAGDITMTPSGEIKEFAITFEANGGSNTVGQVVNYGDKISKPTDPIKDDYTFVCWCTNEELTIEYNFEAPVTKNLTLYAKYIEADSNETATLIIDPNGGSIKVTIGGIEEIITEETTYTKPLGTQLSYEALSTDNEPEYETYTVRFEAKGGVIDSEELVKETTRTIVKSSVLQKWTDSNDEKIGENAIGTYRFMNSDSTDKIIANYTIKEKSNIIAPITTPITSKDITITYNYNYEGTEEETVDISLTMGGWYSADLKTRKANNGGQYTPTNKESNEETLYVYWICPGQRNLPEREGFMFSGWYNDERCSRYVTLGDNFRPTDTIKVYAKWSKTKILIDLPYEGMKVGDLVRYDASDIREGEQKHYEVDTELTGSDKSAEFNSTDEMIWKVLGVDADTGEMLLVSANGTPNSIKLRGETGLFNARQILNSASEVYGYGFRATRARSITFDDIEVFSSYEHNPSTRWRTVHSLDYYSPIFDSDKNIIGFESTLSRAANYSSETWASSDGTYYNPGYNLERKYEHYGYGNANNYMLEEVTKTLLMDTDENYRSYWVDTYGVMITESWRSHKIPVNGSTEYDYDDRYDDAFYGVLKNVKNNSISGTGLFQSFSTYIVKDRYNKADGTRTVRVDTSTISSHTWRTSDDLQVCPVVHIASDVKFVKSGDGTWDLVDSNNAQYTVTFINEGSVHATKTATHGRKVEKPEDPIKQGYKFVGWYSDAELTRKYSLSSPIVRDISVYAKYELNQYTVNFETNGGTNIVSRIVEHGQKIGEINNPTKSNYQFVGWYTDPELTIEYDLDTEVTSDLILYAKWEIAKYSLSDVTTTYYIRLQDAVDNATKTTARITVLNDCQDTSVNIGNKTLTINTNGKTLTIGEINIGEDGNVTINGNGSLISNNSSGQMIRLQGTLNLKDMQIQTQSVTAINSSGVLTLSGNTQIEAINATAIVSSGIVTVPENVTVEGKLGIESSGELTIGKNTSGEPSKFTPVVIGNSDVAVKCTGGKIKFYSGILKGTSSTNVDGVNACLEISSGVTKIYKGGYTLGSSVNGAYVITYLTEAEPGSLYAKLYESGVLAFTASDTLLDGETLYKDYGDISNKTYTSASDVDWNADKTRITKVNFADKIYPTSTAYWFYYCTNLAEFENMENFDTSFVTSMKDMFNNCTSLTEIDVSNFKTNNVTSMYEMFVRCTGLEEIIGINTWETDSLTNMQSMFNNCSSLTALDLSNFDTSNVTTMRYAFYNCTNLESIDLRNLDTSSLDGRSYVSSSSSSLYYGGIAEIFYGCDKITQLDLSNSNLVNISSMSAFIYGRPNTAGGYGLRYLKTLNISNSTFGTRTSLAEFFCNCITIETINLTNVNTSNITDMNKMFYNCQKLTSLDLSSFNTENVTDMSYMFCYCRALTSIDLSGFNTGNLTNMSYMFQYSNNLVEIDFTGINTENVTDMSYMFNGCTALTSLDLSDLDTNSVTTMYCMFYNCTSLEEIIGLDTWQTDNLTTMQTMFYECNSLTSLDLSHFNTHNVTNIYQTFYNCTNLENLNLSNFDSSSLNANSYKTNTSATINTFYGCSKITELNMSNSNLQNIINIGVFIYGKSSSYSAGLVNLTTLNLQETTFGTRTSLAELFKNCVHIETINLTNVNTSNITDMNNMFNNCQKLISLDVSSFNTANVTDMKYMFCNCQKLTSLNISSFNTANVTDMQYMFGGCKELTSLDVSSFNTENVTSMYYMFGNCSQLTSLNLNNFDTRNVTNMNYMFGGCNNLTNITFGTQFVTSGTYTSMFSSCSQLTSLDLRRFTLTSTTVANYMFNNCTSLTQIKYNPSIWEVTDKTSASNRTDWFKNVPSTCQFVAV